MIIFFKTALGVAFFPKSGQKCGCGCGGRATVALPTREIGGQFGTPVYMCTQEYTISKCRISISALGVLEEYAPKLQEKIVSGPTGRGRFVAIVWAIEAWTLEEAQDAFWAREEPYMKADWGGAEPTPYISRHGERYYGFLKGGFRTPEEAGKFLASLK